MLREIENRRSCRKFDEKKAVEREKIEEVVRAGLYAASGMGRQNGIVVAVTDKATRNKISALNARIMGATSDPFYGAPVILLVAVKKWQIAVYDGSTMMENMLVEATHQGLGSCWIHRAKEELETKEGKEFFASLGLNADEYEGVGHVALGYSLIDTYPPKQIKDGRVYWVS